MQERVGQSRNALWVCAALLVALWPAACGDGAPTADGLRDSFAAQLMANPAVSGAQRDGDEITFTGPAAESGGESAWRVVMETAVVEPNEDPALPYKGTVTSAWYADGQRIEPAGAESRLPLELTSNGLAQDCWALWDNATSRWDWE